MMNIIAGDNRIALRFNNFSLHGANGLGIYRLFFVFSYTMEPSKGKKYQVQNVVLEINLKDAKQTTHYLGRAIPKEPVSIESVEHSQPGQLEFILELQPHQVEAIEKLRNGGNLRFEVTLYGEVSGHNQDSGLTNIRNTNEILPVNQSTWLTALKNMGYGDALLFEIPIPKDSTSDIPEKILQYIRTAQKHYLAGHYRETVGDCRNVFDKLEEFLDDKSKTNEISEKYFNNKNSIKSMQKDERYLYIRHAIRHFTHLAHHPEEDEDGKNIPFTRNEAGMVLGQTASLVSFYFNGMES